MRKIFFTVSATLYTLTSSSKDHYTLDKYYRAFEVLFSLLGQWPPIVASLPSGGFAILNGS